MGSVQLYMTVQGGTMVAGSEFDEQELEGYKHGSKVLVRVDQKRDPKDNRQFHAIIGTAIKAGALPWKTIDQAKNVLKLALGFTENGWDHEGKAFRWPKSITKMDQKEFYQFQCESYELMTEIAGVDIMTLKYNAPDTGPDEWGNDGESSKTNNGV